MKGYFRREYIGSKKWIRRGWFRDGLGMGGPGDGGDGGSEHSPCCGLVQCAWCRGSPSGGKRWGCH